MSLIYPKAAWKPVGNHGGPIGPIVGIVDHVAEGLGSLFGWFNSPVSQVSAHLWFAKNGAVEQYVDLDLTAWAQSVGNLGRWSHESEGYSTEPDTADQLQSKAEFWAWAHTVKAVPLRLVDHDGGPGITTHCHYPSGQADLAWGNHPCPGPIRLAQMPATLAAAIQLVTEGDQMYIIACQNKPTFLALAGVVVAIDADTLAQAEADGAHILRVSPAVSDAFARKAA